MMNSPRLLYFITRLLPSSLWPSAMNTSPFAATATSLGEVKWFGSLPLFSGRAEGHQHLACRAEFDDMVAPVVTCGNVAVAHGVGHPDVAVCVHVDSMRPDEHAAAEGIDQVSVRIELRDRRQVRVEALGSELLGPGIAADDGPDVPSVGVDRHLADPLPSPSRRVASPSRR